MSSTHHQTDKAKTDTVSSAGQEISHSLETGDVLFDVGLDFSPPQPPVNNKGVTELQRTLAFSKTNLGSKSRQQCIQQLQRTHGNSYVKQAIQRYNNAPKTANSSNPQPLNSELRRLVEKPQANNVIQRCACGSVANYGESSCESCSTKEQADSTEINRSFDTKTPEVFGPTKPTSAKTIQRGFDIGGFIKGGWDKAVDFGKDLLKMGKDGFLQIIRALSPALADLIEKGPLELIKKTVEGAIEGGLSFLFGPLKLGDLVDNIGKSLNNLLTNISGILTGDPASCANFSHMLEGMGKFINGLLDNPIVNGLKSGLETVTKVIGDISNLVLAPAFDAITSLLGGAWDAVSGLAKTISGWITNVRNVVAPVWDWISEKLGLTDSGEGGVLGWIKEKIGGIWDTIKEKMAPVVEPLKKVAGVLTLFTPLGPIVVIVKEGPKVVKAIQWLWEHKDDPDIIRTAHKEMGDTILPQFLEGLGTLNTTVQEGFKWLLKQVTSLGEGALSLLEGITGVPILNMARGLVENFSNEIKKLVSFGESTLKSIWEGIQTAAAKFNEFIEPYKEVLSSIATAIINPASIPVILAGWAWRKLPDCIKGPIIDFLLDTLTQIVRTIPSLPIFGILWPALKAGVLGFLQGLKAQPIALKIKISDKLAKIVSGASFDFLIGFAKGFVRGIWESVTDPFVLVWKVMEGLTTVHDFFDKLALDVLSPAKPEDKGEGQSQNISEGQAQEGEGRTPPTKAKNQSLGNRVQQMAGELNPPITTVQNNFMGAAKEYFGNSKGMNFNSFVKMLGDLWKQMEPKITQAGTELANEVCKFFAGDKAEDTIGDAVGWLAGTIVFQVVLDILTAGAWTAASPLIKGLIKFLNWPMEFLGEALKLIGKLGGVILKAVKGFASKIIHAGPLKEVVEAIKTIGSKLSAFAEELLGKFLGKAERAAVKDGENVAIREGEKTAAKDAENIGIKESEKATTEPRKIEFTNSLDEQHEITFVDGKLIRCSALCEPLLFNVDKRLTILIENPNINNITRAELQRLKRECEVITQKAQEVGTMTKGASREAAEKELLAEAQKLENELSAIERKVELPPVVSDEQYEKLRDASPREADRKWAKEPANNVEHLNPFKIKKPKYHLDHIVSVKRITGFKDFGRLTYDEQMNVINNHKNFVWLEGGANCSKGERPWCDWDEYKKMGEKVPQELKEKWMKIEQEVESELHQQIKEILAQRGK